MSTDTDSHCVCAERLLALLEEERVALQSTSPDDLAQVCREKVQALQQLSSLLNKLNDSTAEDILPGQRQRLRDLILRCRQQTRGNEALLRVHARRTRIALQLLQGMPGHYDTRGHQQVSSTRTLRGLA